MAKRFPLLISCAPGLEALLDAEMERLGLGKGRRTVRGGVECRGDLRLLYRANLELGLAHHVRVVVDRFSATRLSDVAGKLARIAWEEWVDPAVPLQLSVRSHKGSPLYHTGAIAERLRAAIGAPEPSDGDGNATHLQARVNGSQLTLRLDTSGPPLHRRGYRLETAKAPLREDLARALLLLASNASEGAPKGRIVDPLMGSGVMPIEAALLARRIPPGRGRSFAFERQPGFNAGLWASIKHIAEQAIVRDAPLDIWGSDRDAGAVEAARGNAERAGVLPDLHLDIAALSDAPGLQKPLPESGALITNPPWGERLASKDRRPLYQRLGQLVADMPEWRIAILARDPKLAAEAGAKTEALRVRAGSVPVAVYTR